MTDKLVNVAVQVLPTCEGKNTYDIVDEAIAVIAESGLPYRVCPFETVVEGTYGQVMDVVQRVQEACYQAGAEKIMCYVKIQSSAREDVRIADKIEERGY
ncbi:MAG: thiamine-binding protein [Paludibacteraceae bacterium]|nr:thiamine-binding protein [Paludibacteraceae bacterium]